MLVMKKTVILLLLAAMLAGLAGCQDNQEDGQERAEQTQETRYEERTETADRTDRAKEDTQEADPQTSVSEVRPSGAAAANTGSAQDAGESISVNLFGFCGVYRIEDVKYSAVCGWAPDDAERYLGSVVTYQPGGCCFNGIFQWDYDEFDYETMTIGVFSDSFQVDLSDWWENEGFVTMFQTVNNSSKFVMLSRFFIVDEDTLWLYSYGGFFLAKRIAPEDLDLIEEDCFSLSLDGSGDVRFLAARPDANGSPYADVTFYLEQDGQLVYGFSGFEAGSAAYDDMKSGLSLLERKPPGRARMHGEFRDISFIMFTVFSGRDAFVIGVEYEDPEAEGGSYTEVRLYRSDWDKLISFAPEIATSSAITEILQSIYLPDAAIDSR